jgi:methionine sulfoxide reductase heme-binding subunit
MNSAFELWRDRRGRLSVARIIALILLVMPIGLAVAAALTETRFDARPLNDLIHRSGYWALVFVLVSLAITPLRRIARYGQLVDVRRMIGVGAFCYAAVHILLYVADQMFDLVKVATEIVLRLYLTIGFISLAGLTALAITSNDKMARRIGGLRWNRLHRLVYLIALLAIIHFFQQTKADIWVPTFVASLFTWLMGYRLLIWWQKSNEEPSPLMLAGLAVVASALTFIAEAIGIGIAFSVSPLVVLQMAFDVDIENLDIRPGWLVLAGGLCVVVVDVVRARMRKARPRPTTPTTPPAATVKQTAANQAA